MTATEACMLSRGDRVEFVDPALRFCFFPPIRGVVMWADKPGWGVGICWEGKPAVVQYPEMDFEHVRRVEHAQVQA